MFWEEQKACKFMSMSAQSVTDCQLKMTENLKGIVLKRKDGAILSLAPSPKFSSSFMVRIPY